MKKLAYGRRNTLLSLWVLVTLLLCHGWRSPHVLALVPLERPLMLRVPAVLVSRRSTRWPTRGPIVAMRSSGPDEPAPSMPNDVAAGCGAGWFVFAVPSLTNPQGVIKYVFGPFITIDDAAGHIEQQTVPLLLISAPLFLLIGALLLLLTYRPLSLPADDRSRVGAAVAVASFGGLTAFAGALAGAVQNTLEEGVLDIFATAAGQVNIIALAGTLGVFVATAHVALQAASAVDDPVALYKQDLNELLSLGRNTDVGGESVITKVVTNLYRASALTSIVVGAYLFCSPVSPFAFAGSSEMPVTHWMRQGLGCGICVFSLVQTALFSAARAGELSSLRNKCLNVMTGATCVLLVMVGLAYTLRLKDQLAALPMDEFKVFQEKVLPAGGDLAMSQFDANFMAVSSIGFLVVHFSLCCLAPTISLVL